MSETFIFLSIPGYRMSSLGRDFELQKKTQAIRALNRTYFKILKQKILHQKHLLEPWHVY